MMFHRLWATFCLAFALCGLAIPAQAEDGYDLWLRYPALPVAQRVALDTAVSNVVVEGQSATLTAAGRELVDGLSGLLGREVPLVVSAGDKSVVIGTPSTSPTIAALGLNLKSLGDEGYLIKTVASNGATRIIVTGNTDVAVLYGAFALLREIQTSAILPDNFNLQSTPRVKVRVLNHWDNLNRHVERGYAGQSIWDWHRLPDFTPKLYTDYARANASIGINGTVLNNVNSNAQILTKPYLEKVKALADVFRPYGINVYLSARFNAPMEIGGMKTADPLDPAVAAWWKAKADEIYAAVPDFGGFLVKANSEGQPGPQDFGRSHADGANMLAAAVKPHGGIVMWRAFVYANEKPEDRAKQAFSEFVPLDGKFADNVIIQVKNGAIDFQPREPFHPLFGATPKTPLMMEFQITKEYLGFATHLVYLGPLYEEALAADTRRKGHGSTVAKVVDGTLYGHKLTGMAGVANIGSDRNWSGSHFDQANWYVFGRMAWDPENARARPIAEEWIRQTLSQDPNALKPIADMMILSREAVVRYMTPLGLNHLMDTGHHYGPGPWVNNLARADWNPTYFHKADEKGIGFDRSPSGSRGNAQYAPPLAALFAKPATTPENVLLWFHHVPWDYKMKSGRTLWDELVVTYDQGVADVGTMQATWRDMAPYIDAERHAEVTTFLNIQAREAKWWRDACVAYFGSLSKRPLPAGSPPPAESLESFKTRKFPYAPGNG